MYSIKKQGAEGLSLEHRSDENTQSLAQDKPRAFLKLLGSCLAESPASSSLLLISRATEPPQPFGPLATFFGLAFFFFFQALLMLFPLHNWVE